MATHELYLGGPPTTNYSRGMFPSAPFNEAAEPFLSMRPAAHKGPNSFALNRVLDFGSVTSHGGNSDTALKNWEATATVAQGDVLGLLVIPKHVTLLGVFFNVVSAAGVAMTLTPSLRVAAAAFPAVNGNVVGAALTAPGVVAGITATGSAATIVPWYIAEPDILEVELTAWTSFGSLRLEVTAILQDLSSGQP